MPDRLAHPAHLALASLAQLELDHVGATRARPAPAPSARRRARRRRAARASAAGRTGARRHARAVGLRAPRGAGAAAGSRARRRWSAGSGRCVSASSRPTGYSRRGSAIKRDDRRAAVRVAHGRDDPGGLVQRVDDARLDPGDDAAVELDALARRSRAPDRARARRRRVRGPSARSPSRRGARRRRRGRDTWRGASLRRAIGLRWTARCCTQTLAAAASRPTARRQVWAWLARGAGRYAEMTDLPATLRAALEQDVPLSTLALEREAHASDGTVKALLRTARGAPVEAVLMRYRDGRRSVCLSSQSGCPLTCTFCATGRMRFAGNLSADEILDQALHFRRRWPVDHAVFMGMGEPMMNLDAVLAACDAAARPRHQPAAAPRSRRSAGFPGIERLTASGMLDAPRALAARARGRAAQRADAGQRALPAGRRARRVPRPLRRPAAHRVHRVRDARRRQRPLRAGARARARCSLRARRSRST